MVLDRFQRFWLISLGLHLLVVCLFMFGDAFRLPERDDTKITWIRLSRGDGGTSTKANMRKLDRLPQSTIQEQREALKQLTKIKKVDKVTHGNTNQDTKKVTQKKNQQQSSRLTDKAVPDKQGVNLNKRSTTKSSTDDALKRIYSQLEKREVEIGAAQAKVGETGQSEFGGDEGDAIDPELVGYYTAIKRKINREWLLSKKDFGSGLVAQVVVLIDGSGNIRSTSYKKTSGDGSFDDAALLALKRAAPFPIPPAKISKEALTEGFLIEFDPTSVGGTLSQR